MKTSRMLREYNGEYKNDLTQDELRWIESILGAYGTVNWPDSKIDEILTRNREANKKLEQYWKEHPEQKARADYAAEHEMWK